MLKIPHHGDVVVPDVFLAATSPELLLVPNRLKNIQEGTQGFLGWVRKVYQGDCKDTGDGTAELGQEKIKMAGPRWRKARALLYPDGNCYK